MKCNKTLLRFWAWGLASTALLGCSVENRLGRDAANALASGPIRAYGVEQASGVAMAAAAIDRALEPASGGALDLGAAQAGWLDARLAYDRGAAIFVTVSLESDRRLDGRLDNPLTTGGLRALEPALFGQPPFAAAELERLGAALLSDAVALPDGVRSGAIDIGALLGNMSGLAALVASKLDGSDSPDAGKSLQSMQMNLRGIGAIYANISQLVSAADSELDARIGADLAALQSELDGRSSVDDVADKVGFLRRCGELSQALIEVGQVLGLSVSAPIDVT